MHGAHRKPSNWNTPNTRHIINMALAPHWIFIIIFLTCSIFTAISSPIGVGMDEPSHVSRVIQLSEGNIWAEPVQGTQEKNKQLYGGLIDKALYRDLSDNTVEFYQSQNRFKRYDFPIWKNKDIRGNESFSNKTAEAVFSNSALYSPITYMPHIIGAAIGKLLTNNITVFVLILRLSGILFLSLVIFFCIEKIPIGKWALTTIALLPGNISVNAFVTGDTVLFAATTSFITALLYAIKRAGRVSKANWIILALSCFTIGLAKMTYLPIVLLLFLLVAPADDCKKQTAITVCAIILFSFLSFLVWYLSVHNINSGIMYGRETDTSVQIHFILMHPLQYSSMLIRELFKHNYFTFGYSGIFSELRRTTVPTSGWVSVLALIASLVAFSKSERHVLPMIYKYRRLISLSFVLILGTVFLLIETSLFLQFTPVGSDVIEGVQTRYFLPVLLMLTLLLIMLIEIGHEQVEQSGLSNVRPGEAVFEVPKTPAVFCLLMQLVSAVLYVFTVATSIFM